MSPTKTSHPSFHFSRYFPLCALVAALAWPSDLSATVRFWTGGGTNNNWTTATNWSTGVAPVANDDLIFQGGAAVDVTSLNNTNTYAAGRVFRFEAIMS
ncbi:MAG: hypothetical protein EXS35_09255 [Pedosphaera sp.]|nr:hypothetical protein [Pedosphaera sp.]